MWRLFQCCDEDYWRDNISNNATHTIESNQQLKILYTPDWNNHFRSNLSDVIFTVGMDQAKARLKQDRSQKKGMAELGQG